MGALKLEIFQNGELVQEVPFEGKDVWVGRDDDCVIRLEDRAISRKHALLRSTVDGIEFEKKSKFGQVKVNGKDSDQTLLKNGDRLEFASFEIRVKKTEGTPSVSPPVAETNSVQLTKTIAAEPTSESEIELSPQEEAPVDFLAPMDENPVQDFQNESASAPESVSSSANHTSQFDFAKEDEGAGITRIFSDKQNSMLPVLQFNDGAANVTQYELTDQEIAIGRSQKCNVVLEDRKSSRKHSIIRKDGTQFILKDLGSANGTLVNGERVDEHVLQSGDVVTIGDTEFTFKLIQADYERKKADFIPVPEQVASIPDANALPGFAPVHPGHQFQSIQMGSGLDFGQAQVGGAPGPEVTPDFVAPEPEKKSFIGKFLDRYRAMNTKQQIIYGVVIVVVLYMLLDDSPDPKKAKLNVGNQPKIAKKIEEKKPGTGMTFESLTPEQQRYIENQNQLALDYFKNRDYDSSLLEVEKIFSLVQDYKGARTIESLAREGKHRLEAQEEERKKKEQEKEAQLKLQNLIQQASLFMDKNQFKEAEALFPEIEILQPENTVVSEWRKKIMAENDRIEQEAAQKKFIAEKKKAAWVEFNKVMAFMKEKNYWDALDGFDAILAKPDQEKQLIMDTQFQIKKAEEAIAADRDPLLAEGKQLEQDGKFADAYRAYQKASAVDPTDHESTTGMARIRDTLSGRAKSIYAEGVFAESYGDVESAEKQYRQVLEVVPNDDDYYLKAQSRLKRLTVLRKPASESGVQ